MGNMNAAHKRYLIRLAVVRMADRGSRCHRRTCLRAGDSSGVDGGGNILAFQPVDYRRARRVCPPDLCAPVADRHRLFDVACGGMGLSGNI